MRNNCRNRIFVQNVQDYYCIRHLDLKSYVVSTRLPETACSVCLIDFKHLHLQTVRGRINFQLLT